MNSASSEPLFRCAWGDERLIIGPRAAVARLGGKPVYGQGEDASHMLRSLVRRPGIFQALRQRCLAWRLDTRALWQISDVQFAEWLSRQIRLGSITVAVLPDYAIIAGQFERVAPRRSAVLTALRTALDKDPSLLGGKKLLAAIAPSSEGGGETAGPAPLFAVRKPLTGERISRMSLEDRFIEVLYRTINGDQLSDEARQQLDTILSPESLATLVGVFSTWASSNDVGLGYFIDLLMAVSGLDTADTTDVEGICKLLECLALAKRARSSNELDDSAGALASSLALLGLPVLLRLISRGTVGLYGYSRPTGILKNTGSKTRSKPPADGLEQRPLPVSATRTIPEPKKEPEKPPPDNWVKVEYLYCDGTGVANAHYKVTDLDSGAEFKGQLDESGKAYQSLPIPVTRVKCEFSQDPELKTYLIQPYPNPQLAAVTPGWDDRVVSAISDTGKWVWGAIEGDFNENPEVSQIVLGTVITLIPLVDQAGDVRDIVANLKFLIFDDKYDDPFVWLAVVATLIGLIPELGSAIKGVLKVIIKEIKTASKVPLSFLIEVFNKYVKGHAIKWLRKLVADLPSHGAKAKQLFMDILAGLQARMEQLRKVPGAVREQADALLRKISELRTIASKKIDEAIEKLKSVLGKKVDEGAEFTEEGASKTTVKRKQTDAEPPELDKVAEEDAVKKRNAAKEKLAAQKEKQRLEALRKKSESPSAKKNYQRLSKEDREWIESDKTGRRRELAFDPAGERWKVDEAKTASLAEENGVLKKPVTRASDQSGGEMGDDYFDGDGVGWDAIKGDKDPVKGADDILGKADPVGGKNGENVLVDCSGMTAAEKKALQDELSKRPPQAGRGEIKFVP